MHESLAAPKAGRAVVSLMATYTIVEIEGLKQSNRRGLALLASDDDKEVDAAVTFNALDPKRDRELRSRFETWIDGVQHNNRWFHGFDCDPYRSCLVFKWKASNQAHRLYGFLCHPCPKSNNRFELCVLTNHAAKSQWETDPSELKKAASLRVNPHVQGAIQMQFPDHAAGTYPCLQ